MMYIYIYIYIINYIIIYANDIFLKPDVDTRNYLQRLTSCIALEQ